MNIIKFLIILLFYCFNIAAQLDSSTYYHKELKHKKGQEYLQKKIKSNKYTNVFLKNIDLHNLACSYSLTKDYKKCIETINVLLERNILTNNHCTDPDFYNVSHTKEWKSLLIKINNNNEKHLEDTVFIDLISIAINDQTFFNEIDYYERKKSSKLIGYLKTKDSLNILNLNLIKYYLSNNINVLSDSVVGETFSRKCFLVIQHSDPATMEVYLPIIKELFDKKQTRGENYALLYDRVSLFKNKGVQFYGSQINPETKQPFLIKDEKNVDKRREELGMEPLGKYLQLMNIIYNPKRKK